MTRSPARVLIVDDDVDACSNLSDILSDSGYAVTVAHSGEAALDLAQRELFDVALLDLKLPGIDGLTLYREIKQRSAGTVALFVSAYAVDVADAALQAGAWQVLHKPVEIGRLLSLLEVAAGQSLILVVDDDRELCANLWDVLRGRGYRVDLASTAEHVAQLAAARRHDVVLVDWRLPEAADGAVFRSVRRLDPDARIVVITGHRSDLEATVQQTLAEGADAVCFKPFEVPELLATVGRLAMPCEPPA